MLCLKEQKPQICSQYSEESLLIVSFHYFTHLHFCRSFLELVFTLTRYIPGTLHPVVLLTPTNHSPLGITGRFTVPAQTHWAICSNMHCTP